MDREKVIKAWEIFRDSNPYKLCSGREFRAIREPKYCMGQMIEDTIALLKEHDTVEHALDILREHGWKETEDVPYANEQERHPVIVCPHCGKRVK